MKGVFSFDDYRKKFQHYDEVENGVEERMAEIGLEVFGLALNVAMAGPWKTWNEGVAEGTTMKFDPDMLFGTGDDNVEKLMRIWKLIADEYDL